MEPNAHPNIKYADCLAELFVVSMVKLCHIDE